MKKNRKMPRDGKLVWERSEPTRRPAPKPLSRDRIVDAALRIADKEGLGSVSLRNVASALSAGPMRLYGYLSTKKELLDLMVDAVFGEIVSAQPRRNRRKSDWKTGMRVIAHRTRKSALEHPWLVDLLGGRPHLGPNALIYLERSLATLNQARGFAVIDDVLVAASTVNAYIIGAVRSEMSQLQAESESGLDEKGWQAATGPYMERMIATGRFPTMARVVKDATHPSPEIVFDQGLECILDGIQSRLLKT